jgi:hypothetical protein
MKLDEITYNTWKSLWDSMWKPIGISLPLRVDCPKLISLYSNDMEFKTQLSQRVKDELE